jgi:hypothetical protein
MLIYSTDQLSNRTRLDYKDKQNLSQRREQINN